MLIISWIRASSRVLGVTLWIVEEVVVESDYFEVSLLIILGRDSTMLFDKYLSVYYLLSFLSKLLLLRF